MDRIQLKMVKAVLHELHLILDLASDEKEKDDKGSVSLKLKLPLNQLTWMELVRMRILCAIYAELGKGKEDMQHVIRGSRLSGFKSFKNVVRQIRYRLALRAMPTVPTAMPSRPSAPGGESLFAAIAARSKAVDDVLALMHCALSGAQLPPTPTQTRPQQLLVTPPSDSALLELAESTAAEGRYRPDPALNRFVSEQDLLASLAGVAADPLTYSEEYRRAAKVMVKILGLGQAKNFIWEVDSASYPDYYKTLLRPVFFVHVACKLLDKAYDGDAGVGVGAQFYEDMRSVAVNCIVYNSEVTGVVAQAQKLVAAIYRHVDRWMSGGSASPSLEQCDEKYCLYSFQLVERGSPLKCGKCLGTYSYQSMYQLSQCSSADSPSLQCIYPSIEIQEQPSEEWVCPFCLREDSCALVPGLVGGNVSAQDRDRVSPLSFAFDEWGPSGTIPWLLNGTYSSELQTLLRRSPEVAHLLETLQLVTHPYCSSLLPSFPHKGGGGGGGGGAVVCKSMATRPWTLSERLTVLSGLCVLLNTDASIGGAIENLYAECDQLVKVSSKPNFREADFMSLVRAICGEEGVTYCRALLDGISVESQNQLDSSAYLQNMVTEGRCVICNGSTFEEEPSGDESGDQILLCDGCNAEAHLRCLNLSAVRERK